MAFRWVHEDAGGAEKGASPEFATREEAEAWMGREWEAALESGAVTSTLKHGDKRIYRMKLTAD